MTIADMVAADPNRVAPEVADAEAEEDDPLPTEVGIEMTDGLRDVMRLLVLETELGMVKAVTDGDELEDGAEEIEFEVRVDDEEDDMAEVTLDDCAELLNEAELAVKDSEAVPVATLEDLAEPLPTDTVEVTVSDGALATEDGTGRLEVSLSTGALNDPDMPARL